MAWPPTLPPGGRTNATLITDAHPSDHNLAAAALADLVTYTNPTAWTALPLAAGWSNFGSGYQVGQYRKVGDVVQVRGLITHAAVAAPIAVTTALPVGFRPPALMQCGVIGGGLVVTLQVDAAGVLTAVGISSGTITTILFPPTSWSVTV